jgi:hypothetical protein
MACWAALLCRARICASLSFVSVGQTNAGLQGLTEAGRMGRRIGEADLVGENELKVDTRTSDLFQSCSPNCVPLYTRALIGWRIGNGQCGRRGACCGRRTGAERITSKAGGYGTEVIPVASHCSDTGNANRFYRYVARRWFL